MCHTRIFVRFRAKFVTTSAISEEFEAQKVPNYTFNLLRNCLNCHFSADIEKMHKDGVKR